MSDTTIRGAKGGSKQHTPVESPDNLRSIAYFRILDLVSEGEIAGLVNGQQSIYLDETPLVNSDGSSNFPKAHIEQRTGTQDQTAIPGFDSVENEISVGTELRSSSAWVQSITDTTLSAVRITIGVPALSKANTSNGDINGYTISYKIEVSTDGGAYAAAYNGSFTGKTTSKYQRSHRIDLPDATSGWTLRVTRLTANADSASIADTTTIDSYTEIVDAKLLYPNSALVALMGDASQFSNIPNRAYDLFGRIIQVPSNYDVATRTYSGTWDGSFKPSWTDNPAWIFYDLATHPRYGLGHLVDSALVDKWELYRIGQYCDGLVDDGMGGQEPRLTCNVYLQVQADAYKLLNDLSSAFRGISFWSNGTIVASADMPIDPAYTYTDANVIGGQFSYSASARKARFTTALVSWNDPNNFFRTKVEYVEDRDGIARYGVQQTAVTAVGCTSQGQAQRLGRWILLTSRLETNTVTFRVGLDGVLVAPGQIIRIADSARAGRRQGGRISSATTTTVTLDKVPTIAAGDTITVGMPDGISQTRTVDSVTGATVTVTVAFSAAPVAQSVWTVESLALAAQTFRVLSVTEDKSDTELSFTITALQHNASKFDAVDFGTLIQVPPISALTITNQVGPGAVSLESAEVVDPVATTQLLTIAWTAVPTALAYEAEWRKDDGEWHSLGIITGLSADVRGAGAGDYVARVRAKGTGRSYSLYSYSNVFTLGAATTLPTTVAGIQAEANQAAADAAAANAELANIASDNILSQGEKPLVIRDYNVITTEQAGIDGQASSFGITTEKTAYDNAVTALTSYLGTLTSPTAWNNLSGDTVIVGTTFRQKFADVYTTRQALLNAIYAAAKVKADAAQGTANNAASTKSVINPQFLDGLSAGWTYDNAAGFYVITNADTPDSAQPCHLGRNGQSGAPTTAARNLGYVAVQVGQTVIANCCIKAISCNVGAAAQVRISWRDSNHTELSVTLASVTCGPGGTYLQCVSKAMGQAPAGAQFAHLELYFTNHTSGYFTATSANLGVQPSTIDEVPDGPTNSRTLATRVNGGKPVIDFSEGIHFNKQLDNIGDGPTYGRPLNARLSGGNPLIDFSAGYHLNKNIDNLADGSIYARAKASSLQGGVPLQASLGRNICPNGSFELNVSGSAMGDGWSNGGSYLGIVRALGISGAPSNAVMQYNAAPGSVIPTGVTYTDTHTVAPLAVTVGDTVYVSAQFQNAGGSPPAGITGVVRVSINFINSSGGVINSVSAYSPLTAGWPKATGSGIVPAGTVSAQVQVLCYTNNTTGSAYTVPAGSYPFFGYVDNISVYTVSSLDTDVADGSTYGRTVQSRLSSGVPFIDFAAGIHLNKNVDNVGDGSTYARIKGTELSSGIHKLGVAGSGALLGNQLNIPNSLTLNYGAVRSSTALTASSTGAVSVNAFTYYMGAATVPYSAVSNAVTGLTQGVAYYIYTRDPGGTGGMKTWSATTNVNALLQTYDDIVVAGQVTIPTSGTSGGGGTGGCPVVGAWVIRRTADGWAFARAGDIAEGDELLLTSGQWGRVSHSRAVLQPCVIVQDAEGFALSCSRSAPLGRSDGSQVLAPDAAGELIESRTSIVKGASRIAIVRDIGDQWVQHITCENDFFWVGDEPGRLFSHHNLKP